MDKLEHILPEEYKVAKKKIRDLRRSSLPEDNVASEALLRLRSSIFAIAHSKKCFTATDKTTEILFGTVKGRKITNYQANFKDADFNERDIESLVTQGSIKSEAHVDMRNLFELCEKYEHGTKMEIFAAVTEVLASKDTNPYIAFIEAVEAEKTHDRIIYSAEIDRLKVALNAAFAELKKQDKIISQQENRIDQLKAELEKFKPYLDGSSGNLDWDALVRNSNKLFIQDTSSLTIKELKNLLEERELLIGERTRQLIAMQIELVTLGDDLNKALNSIEIIQQEKENSYQSYRQLEIANENLITEINIHSEKFIETTLKSSEIANENLVLKSSLISQKLEDAKEIAFANQRIYDLQLELQKNKDNFLMLQESHFIERIKTNVILVLNVSTSVVPGQTYSRIVKTFETSMLASRALNSPVEESKQWMILTFLCIGSIIYNIYKITDFFYHYLLNFWKWASSSSERLAIE